MYKNSLKLSTNILSKRFTIDQVKNTFKSNILYSSRIKNAHSIFAPATPSIKCTKNFDLVDRGIVREKKGPMGIAGVTCSGGLLTFAMAGSKYQPKNASMLMLDVYAKEKTSLIVKLISDYFGNKIEYFVKGYTDGSIKDYQAAALVMAICINGMTIDEISNLTIKDSVYKTAAVTAAFIGTASRASQYGATPEVNITGCRVENCHLETTSTAVGGFIGNFFFSKNNIKKFLNLISEIILCYHQM